MTYSDKIKHFFLLLFVTVFGELFFRQGLLIAIVWAVVIELTQAEAGNATIKQFLQRLFSADSLLDLGFDALGILAGLVLMEYIPLLVLLIL